ncbi:hypothetical protein, partial [Streptomyces chartreusis]|uniref:hypothetical protein n=1 Tax=Streptomyces chartreusis TaxID=1969 RepID=UPI0037D7BCE0
ATLNDDDRQLIGTALTHPHATITELARHYNRVMNILHRAYEELGSHLDRPGTAVQVLAYVRGHQDEILRLAGLDLNCLPEIPHHTAALNDGDRQLIGTALTHPHATIAELAHHYNRVIDSLTHAYERLGTRLNAPGTAAQVLTYIRGHQDEVLLLAGLSHGSLPEIPRQTATALTPLHKQLIGTALIHPHATIAELARHYNWQISTLHHAYQRLGPRLNAPVSATQVLNYIREHQDDVLLMAGLQRDNLPEIDRR